MRQGRPGFPYHVKGAGNTDDVAGCCLVDGLLDSLLDIRQERHLLSILLGFGIQRFRGKTPVDFWPGEYHLLGDRDKGGQHGFIGFVVQDADDHGNGTLIRLPGKEGGQILGGNQIVSTVKNNSGRLGNDCLLYTSDAADDLLQV